MSEKALEKAWSDHSRLWEHNIWVYPVISRRAGGLSIGINLNLDKRCSFDCAYCQVDRTIPGKKQEVDIARIEEEIETIIAAYEKNGLADFSTFKDVEEEKREIKDISLSGDGESTTVKEFPEVCKLMRKMQDKYPNHPLKLTLITNATMLGLPSVREGLKTLTEKRGEIWAKLDAGSSEWYKKINRSAVSLEKIQQNIESAVKDFPLRIQTLFCKIKDEFPSEKEIELYIARLKRIYEVSPKNLLGIQLYGVVRHTATPDVHPLEKSFLENVARKIQREIPTEVDIY
ncbi:MAG: hypothetical protein M0P13_04125 [Fibrobacteraceae bacterium]|nr:hypothetical protein [Fibrobacteraceae bacterium]